MKALRRHSITSAVIATLTVLAVTQGCSDDGDNPTPPPPIVGQGGEGGDGTGNTGNIGSGGEGATSSAGTGNEGGTGNTGNTGNGGEGGEPPLPLPECDSNLPERGPNGCYNCPEDGETEQWLNRCVAGDCLPFNNAARLPRLGANGERPPLE